MLIIYPATAWELGGKPRCKDPVRTSQRPVCTAHPWREPLGANCDYRNHARSRGNSSVLCWPPTSGRICASIPVACHEAALSARAVPTTEPNKRTGELSQPKVPKQCTDSEKYPKPSLGRLSVSATNQRSKVLAPIVNTVVIPLDDAADPGRIRR